MNITTSPDISVLDFSVLFDISTATPTITITNLSSGPDLASCTWWYYVVTPGGNYIHKGSQGTPDMTGIWASLIVPDTWPQPDGQIQWSGNDYIVTLFVRDGIGGIYSLVKSGGICRPGGNYPTSIGNFGASNVNAIVRCEDAKLYTEDITSYSYKGKFGTSVSNQWVLTYPPAADGFPPDPVVLNNYATGLFPLGYNGAGYYIILNTIRLYDIGNGFSVKIQYKYRKEFTVACNVDLCPLICDIDKLISEVNASCSQQQDPESVSKLAVITALLTKALVAKQQPLCGYNVYDIVQQIKEIGGFTCDCITAGDGINPGGSSSSNINISFEECGDITATVPSQVGNNITLRITDYTYLFELTDQAAASGFSWVENTDTNTCTKTWTLGFTGSTGGDACPPNFTIAFLAIHETENPPAGCPNPVWPKSVYDIADVNIIGVADDINALVGILNADTGLNGWRTVYGIARAIDNCTVEFPCYTTDDVPIFKIHVEDGPGPIPPCLDTVKTFETKLFNYNAQSDELAQITFPGSYYVQYTVGGIVYALGTIASYGALITALNAESHKPGNLAYAASSGLNPITVKKLITDASCMQVDTITIYEEVDGTISIGSNTDYLVALSVNKGPQTVDTLLNTELGYICGVLTGGDLIPWNMVRYGNFVYTVGTNNGYIYKFNMANPLYPVLANQVQLIGGTATAFTGVPNYTGAIPSHWDVYIQTDYSDDNQFMYILESTSGNIWKYNIATDTVVATFQSNYLIGMCPRAVINGFLYFSFDGNRINLTGQTGANPVSSGGFLLGLKLFQGFNASNIVQYNMPSSTDLPWALSYEPSTNILWCSTQIGNLIGFPVGPGNAGLQIPTAYNGAYNVSGGFSNLLNTTIYNGIIYASSYGKGTMYIDLSAIGPASSVAFAALPVASANHFTFTPVPGKSYGLLCYKATTGASVSKYSYAGAFIKEISIGAGNIYNLVPFNNSAPTTPNGYC